MQVQISWLLQKPTDLDLHCLLRQGMSCSARDGLNIEVHVSTLELKAMDFFFVEFIDVKTAEITPKFKIMSFRFYSIYM